ncbi:hypothetical protein RZR97_04800 [Hydrogenimonas thermophila]|uniref:hypothetical protein n=1 Tax=Hydrogenimonas thermophila TaxID=223786 RepID=UPI002937492B|nr:hypothetical protein [Hydrogenimonas thermophila]WOE70894.1 hypothetical protein RZR91_04820 [Hydrogenimonas thermophila]WOE73412.1 hypothetical protein RZR97_04800 [Hydrogenimonas thermophila]
MKNYYNLLLVILIFLMSGCAIEEVAYISPSEFKKSKDLIYNMPVKDKTSLLIKDALSKIKDAKYSDAIAIINRGLRQQPSNAHLHFLNALSYHYLSLNGDIKMEKLAESGYKASLRFDGSNYLAAYLLGNIYFKQKKFLKAQNYFSSGLIYASNNPYLLRGLAVASYYCNDISLSNWASEKADKIDPNNLANIKNLMFVKAAKGEMEEAYHLFKKYRSLAALGKSRSFFQEEKVAYIQTRLKDWNDFHVRKIKNLFGFDNDQTTDSYEPDGNDKGDEIYVNKDEQIKSSSSILSKEKFVQNMPNMILVDVVIIETEELRSESKGINLLEGLQVTLSGSISYDYSSSGDIYDSGWTVSPEFSFAGLSYSFNIFNDGANKAEILASPSLLAVEGSTSSFHSGSTLHVALDSTIGDASLEDVDVGISLQITPTFYKNELIKIEVHAQRSQLEPLFEEVGFKSAAQTSKTSVDATAILKIGDTLILSGLTQTYKNRSESGVPVLQDVPVAQYFFSNENDSNLKKSIMILLTPQKARYFNNYMSNSDDIQKDTKYTIQLKKQEGIKTENISQIR